jgi:large subunit ribosomal protein L29
VKANELRDMSPQELAQALRDTSETLWNFRFQMATGTVDNVRGLRNARRDIARIKTEMRRRELAASQ